MHMPTEPAGSRMSQSVKARAYPARIAGPLLWVYLGDARQLPELPAFGFIGQPDAHVYASRWQQECNYAQAMEGEFDSAHVSFLHQMVNKTDPDNQALTGKYFQEDTAPSWKILPGGAGFMACNGRRVEGDNRYWRVNQFLLPFFSMIPPRPGDAQLVRMWVPMTDLRELATGCSAQGCGACRMAQWRQFASQSDPRDHAAGGTTGQRLPD